MAPHKINVFLNQIVEFIAHGEPVGRKKVTKISNLDVLHSSRISKGYYGVEVIQVYSDKDADLPHAPLMDEDVKTPRPRVDLVRRNYESKEWI